ncbi:peptide transporter family 1 isoform X2 [Venturia canescens]|uniref:peptide transporter family 1 isoform X2 n=1 Tax=Venturia canescens TaxID=32260 RepID=UPI001C9CFA8B|nr:peptide transporter family 1 isoform X2 [Venturia canescens]
MTNKGTSEGKKLKYPKSVFFIVCNEFCERFSYYGMRTILSLYLLDKLSYDPDTATVIYHVFSMFVYFFPLFGAMLADSLLGKFRTIFYLSVIYAAGQLLLSATAVPSFGIPVREFSLLGLLLIAIGSGGIKPCVAAFGGDQFVLPQQESHLVTFFSVFYFAINSGSLISSFLTPELRYGVQCFGDRECYSLAFFVPAVLMVASIVVFVLGKPLYRIKDPQGNVVLNVTKCMSRAIYNKNSKKEKREHWLDHADDKYDRQIIEDIKAALRVLTLFIPLPIFWALFDQQASRWTFQATRMDGLIGNFILKADQMQVVNPLFIVIFIPIFETCIYPIMAKIRMIDTPLKKLTVGGFMAALAFVISGIVELQLQKTYPVLPSQGVGQLRVFNPQNCYIVGQIGNENVTVEPYGMWVNRDIHANSTEEIGYSVNFENCSDAQPKAQTGKFLVTGDQSTSYALLADRSESPYGYRDFVNKSGNADPAVQSLVYNENFNGKPMHLKLEEKSLKKEYSVDGTISKTKMEELNPATYDVELDGKLVDSLNFKQGGVYTVIIHVKGDHVEIHPIAVSEPNSIHILWLIPQYIIITMGEVMFSVTGLEFAFTQAPATMKSLLQAGWLLTVAFGNLIVVIVAEVKFFNEQSSEFFLFAALMTVDMIIFAVMAKFYKYAELPETDSAEPEFPLEESCGGHLNHTFEILATEKL